MDLAIIGASYLQLPLINKAKEMGYTTHVFAWAADDVGENAADYFYPISIRDVDEITEQCRKIGICGICSIATDLGNYTVNYVAEKLGLVGNSMECTMKSTNKYLMRQAFLECGDPSPLCLLIDDKTNLDRSDISYPAIVKPTDRSGSKGITLVNNADEMKDAVERALLLSFEKRVLIENLLDGDEYSVEGISYKGEHHILAITQKYTTGSPHFIETGHREPVNLNVDMVENIEKTVKHALDTLEVKNSASHSEIMIDDNGDISIVEIGSRMGGDCIGSDLVYLSTGIDYLRAVIQLACGEKPDLSSNGNKSAAEVRFILTPDDLMEFERLKAEEPNRIIRVVDDKHFGSIGKTTSSSNRAGCYIVSVP